MCPIARSYRKICLRISKIIPKCLKMMDEEEIAGYFKNIAPSLFSYWLG